MRAAVWMPPAAWMAVIAWLSSDAGSAEITAGLLLPLLRWIAPWATPGQLDALHGIVRKGAHLAAYGVLAALWYRTFRAGHGMGARPSAWAALAISLGWAFLDEWRQATLPTRTASAGDVALDGAGATLALTLARAGWRATADRATGALLWIGAAGGALALAADAWAGVGAGALWVTTPLAAVGLLFRRRARHGRRPGPRAP